MNKEQMHKLIHEVLILLNVIACLSVIMRIWPVVLLALIGIFCAAFRLIFMNVKQPKQVETLPIIAQQAVVSAEPEVNEQTMLRMAFGIFQTCVTKELLAVYPEARWIWDSAHPMTEFAKGGRIMLRLNHAGGYRKAWAVTKNLQFVELTFEGSEAGLQDQTPDDEETEYQKPVVNYELLACDWVAKNIICISTMANDAIARNDDICLIPGHMLPAPDSWPSICQELDRRGEFAGAVAMRQGIEISIK